MWAYDSHNIKEPQVINANAIKVKYFAPLTPPLNEQRHPPVERTLTNVQVPRSFAVWEIVLPATENGN